MKQFLKSHKIFQCSLCIVLSMGIVSCANKKFDSEKELWAHVKGEENGYHYVKTLGTVSYALTYRPTDVLVKQELRDRKSVV